MQVPQTYEPYTHTHTHLEEPPIQRPVKLCDKAGDSPTVADTRESMGGRDGVDVDTFLIGSHSQQRAVWTEPGVRSFLLRTAQEDPFSI